MSGGVLCRPPDTSEINFTERKVTVDSLKVFSAMCWPVFANLVLVVALVGLKVTPTRLLAVKQPEVPNVN